MGTHRLTNTHTNTQTYTRTHICPCTHNRFYLSTYITLFQVVVTVDLFNGFLTSYLIATCFGTLTYDVLL